MGREARRWSDLLDDVGVQHGQPLGDEGQAAHAGEHLQRRLDGVGLQQGLVDGGIQALVARGHGLILGAAAQHLTVLHWRGRGEEGEREGTIQHLKPDRPDEQLIQYCGLVLLTMNKMNVSDIGQSDLEKRPTKTNTGDRQSTRLNSSHL